MSKVSIEGNASGTGTLTIAAPNTNSNFTLSLPTNTGTIITQNSTPAFASTIGVGGATAAASGAGITFPATQSASSDANTLDDYEQGTWTPAFSASGATFTYGVEVAGWYTKVGRVVHAGFTLSTTARSGGSGDLTITGLPFTSHNVVNGPQAGCIGTINNWVHTASYVEWGIRVQINSTSMNIFQFGNAGGQVGDNFAGVGTIPTSAQTNLTGFVSYVV
jgi:hypothetical protein